MLYHDFRNISTSIIEQFISEITIWVREKEIASKNFCKSFLLIFFAVAEYIKIVHVIEAEFVIVLDHSQIICGWNGMNYEPLLLLEQSKIGHFLMMKENINLSYTSSKTI